MQNKEKLLTVVNPTAYGGIAGRNWLKNQDLFLKKVSKKFNPKVFITHHPGHTTSIIRQALLEGIENFVVVGGDGTIDEAINGFFPIPDPNRKEPPQPINPNARLSILGAGTGGDFLKTLGLPKRLEDAIDVIMTGKESADIKHHKSVVVHHPTEH